MAHAYLCYHDHFQRTFMVFEFIILGISRTLTAQIWERPVRVLLITYKLTHKDFMIKSYTSQKDIKISSLKFVRKSWSRYR